MKVFMPLLRIQTNAPVLDEVRDRLLVGASQWIVRELNKPIEYVQVTFETMPMMFAGSGQPSAFLELRALGFPHERSRELSSSLTTLVSSAIAVPASRVFINFVDVPRHLWGWNGSTFGTAPD